MFSAAKGVAASLRKVEALKVQKMGTTLALAVWGRTNRWVGGRIATSRSTVVIQLVWSVQSHHRDTPETLLEHSRCSQTEAQSAADRWQPTQFNCSVASQQNNSADKDCDKSNVVADDSFQERRRRQDAPWVKVARRWHWGSQRSDATPVCQTTVRHHDSNTHTDVFQFFFYTYRNLFWSLIKLQ